ncbi:nuclear transport factor 2 family protein [Novosphingobium sp. 9U]|uniref:nuclear transport factor 2 family protein n=1 Tax=Novosphingobium sp. 9U TaxID=2653158 RepID=UPI0012EF1E59|nr:nuclear transport factor 2 family protein [Novosphingobium sp. 9U]VWX46987.1 conserved hypothetical protein [Novosphingobium sp. 9U]
MAQFTPQQAADVLAIKQVIYEWGDELDINNGLKILDAGVLADDVRYFVGGEWREGKQAVAQFYQGRKATLGDNAPVMRHIISSLRVSLDSADHAKVGYLLVFFAKAGTPPFEGYCDPLAVADVKMECTRGADGEWRISLFDSGQIFKR